MHINHENISPGPISLLGEKCCYHTVEYINKLADYYDASVYIGVERAMMAIVSFIGIMVVSGHWVQCAFQLAKK